MSVIRENQFVPINPDRLWEAHCAGSYKPPGYERIIAEVLRAAARVARTMKHPVCAKRIEELLK